jgi:hypothetical protein
MIREAILESWRNSRLEGSSRSTWTGSSPPEEAGDAHGHMEERRNRGKIMIHPAD